MAKRSIQKMSSPPNDGKGELKLLPLHGVKLKSKVLRKRKAFFYLTNFCFLSNLTCLKHQNIPSKKWQNTVVKNCQHREMTEKVVFTSSVA